MLKLHLFPNNSDPDFDKHFIPDTMTLDVTSKAQTRGKQQKLLLPLYLEPLQA